jgi:hypothetical protein
MVDDATALYIVENQNCFEDLKQVAAQLAGLLVLAASGSKEASPDHPTLLSARELFREADQLLRGARPTERAQKHHIHVSKAAVMIGAALQEVDRGFNVDRVLIPLRSGYAQLELAADSLPGFEKISYGHACCGRGRIQ